MINTCGRHVLRNRSAGRGATNTIRCSIRIQRPPWYNRIPRIEGRGVPKRMGSNPSHNPSAGNVSFLWVMAP
ncbi:hypothetical protein E2C01_042990 [Portunus trituberculatus]|uniref:Uncharacterized protein n=1 Tax=Portunus trituberculatus TaxID=210409 RepID=A0A5B7FY10_PORTR|nr:hypothetical protein [Portunus trituberculatus]